MQIPLKIDSSGNCKINNKAIFTKKDLKAFKKILENQPLTTAKMLMSQQDFDDLIEWGKEQ